MVFKLSLYFPDQPAEKRIYRYEKAIELLQCAVALACDAVFHMLAPWYVLD